MKTHGRWRAQHIGRNQIIAAIAAVALIAALANLLVGGFSGHRQDIVVFVGDSITEGVASTDPITTSRPGLYQTHVGNDVIVANEGVNGITLGSLAGRVSSIESYYHAGRKNVVVIDGGSNDFAQGTKAAPLFKILRDYVTRLQNDGWIVGVATVMRRNGLSPGQEHERQAFNRMILSGPFRAQDVGILDFDAEERAGHIQIADGVHPSDLGYRQMVKLDIAFADHALGRY